MGIKNAIKKALGIAALAGTSLLPSVAKSQGYFKTYNYSNDSTPNNSINFVQDGPLGSYLPRGPPSFETYNLDENTNKHSDVGVDVNASKTYICPLEYSGNIPNGVSNSVCFRFVNNQFPSNLLFTLKVVSKDKVQLVDARRAIVGGPNPWPGYGQVAINTTSNAVNGQVYGTNFVNIAPIETTIKKLDYDKGANECWVHADVRPGTISWIEYCDNLTGSKWVAITNSPHKKYAEVTTNNFGKLERLTWGNLPAGNGQRFWRIQNVVWDPAYTNGLGGGFEEEGFSSKSSSNTTVTPTVKTSTYPKSLKDVLKLR